MGQTLEEEEKDDGRKSRHGHPRDAPAGLNPKSERDREEGQYDDD